MGSGTFEAWNQLLAKANFNSNSESAVFLKEVKTVLQVSWGQTWDAKKSHLLFAHGGKAVKKMIGVFYMLEQKLFLIFKWSLSLDPFGLFYSLLFKKKKKKGNNFYLLNKCFVVVDVIFLLLLVWLVEFYGISTLVSYLMPSPVYTNFHHTTCKSTCDTLPSSAANQGW